MFGFIKQIFISALMYFNNLSRNNETRHMKWHGMNHVSVYVD